MSQAGSAGGSGGSGDVVGPVSSTDNAVARWDGITGKLLKDSVAILSNAGALSGLTQLDVDNIQVNGNTISSTNANGNIVLSPNGTGIANVSTNVYIGSATPSNPYDLSIEKSVSGLIGSSIQNTSNNAAAGANQQIIVEPATADAFVQYVVNGATTWSSGIDNSDSDKWKLTTGASPSAGTEALSITTAAIVTANSLTVTNASTFSGSQSVKRTATAADYVVLTSDYLIGVTSTAAPRAITLPSASVATGQTFIIKDESGGAGTNNITISVNGGVKTIDGSASLVINGNYDAYTVYYDGTNYFSC